LTFLAVSNGTTRQVFSGTTGFNELGSWVFFALSYDGSSATNNVVMYSGSISSTVVQRSTGSVDRGTLSDENTKFHVGNVEANSRGFNGSLDDIRLYSGILDTSALESVRVSAIPEPSSYGLILGALASALVLTRRKRIVAK
jgi:hypothetical protein